jgi:hypothetical protein
MLPGSMNYTSTKEYTFYSLDQSMLDNKDDDSLRTNQHDSNQEKKSLEEPLISKKLRMKDPVPS